MRDVHELSDGDIVQAIAECGIFGVDVGTDLDDDRSPSPQAEALAFALDLAGDEEAPADDAIVRLLLARVWVLANAGNPVECHEGTTICLTLDYWAEQLAHRSKEQCRSILYNGPR